MELNRYIKHPELLDRETLYDLRSHVALYPYHQSARLLMLQNLYLMHDPSFGDELRQAAFYISDRTVLFNLVEARHYQISRSEKKKEDKSKDRTDTLIDIFLESLPKEPEPEVKTKREPTVTDATIDYVAYLMETDSFENYNCQEETAAEVNDNANSRHTSTLIDNFLENEGGKIILQESSSYTPHTEVELENDSDEIEDGYFTETLAKIYIKQGNYSKALEIIQRLNLIFPKKSAYFADQMRYLEKIILIKQ